MGLHISNEEIYPAWALRGGDFATSLRRRARERRTRAFPPTPHDQPQAIVVAAPVEPDPERQAIVVSPICPHCGEDVDDLAAKPRPSRITLLLILGVVSRRYKIPVIDLVSSRRTRDVVWPRQIAAYLGKTLTTQSLPQIGHRLGGRDHTTVLHAYRKVEALMIADPAIQAEIDDIKRELTP